MNRAELERILELLKNYDSKMRDKAEQCANMMADWIGTSQSEAERYAEKYATIRVERQRINDSIFSLEFFLNNELDDKQENE